MNIGKAASIGALVLLGTSIASAQTLLGQEKVQAKQIIERSFNSEAQEVLIEFDTAIPNAIADRRIQLHKDGEKRKRLEALTGAQVEAIESEIRRQDAQLIDELQRAIGKVKAEVFASDGISGAHVIQDFPNLPTALVSVPDANALSQLLKHKRVKAVNENGPVYTAANWAAAQYTDVSLIAGPVFNSPDPRTGKDTRVVVIDQPAYISGLFGFNNLNNAPDGCYPYSGLNFTNDNLAGGWNSSAACRVWDAYNFATKTEQYCANPYGNPVGVICPHEHGTAVMNVVLRTAPSTYITALQVYDRYGNSKDSYLIDALNWVIQNRYSKPTIVAVNLSLRQGVTKYTDYCPSTSAAGALSTLLRYGILPVVASSNFGWKDGVTAPACVQGVISVGAVADSPTLPSSYPDGHCSDPTLAKDQVGCFSNAHRKLVTVLAPGIEIGNAKYPDEGMHTGTSLAAPHVAGQVAILKGSDVYPTKGVYEITDLIKYNGTPIADRLAPEIVLTRVDIKKSITPPKIKSMVVSPSSASLNVGATVSLKVASATDTTGAPMPVPKVITWSSSNASAATVDANGVVTGKASGTAIISAASGGVVASSTIRVAVKQSPPPDCQTHPEMCR